MGDDNLHVRTWRLPSANTGGHRGFASALATVYCKFHYYSKALELYLGNNRITWGASVKIILKPHSWRFGGGTLEHARNQHSGQSTGIRESGLGIPVPTNIQEVME